MKKFENPEIKIHMFQTEDVITTSDPTGVEGDGNTGSDGGIRN